MSHAVFLLEEAVQDIASIYRYIRNSGNKAAARQMVVDIRLACDSLCENPERSHVPPELSRIGQFEYRQIIARRYHILYQIAESHVFIFGIIHGSRNIGEVLRQRLVSREW
jgi:toxin ParE1/3/4